MERALHHATARAGYAGSGSRDVLKRLRLWLDLWSERRALRRLDPHLLRDMGIGAEDAEREATRRPWDVPPGRL